MNLLVHHFCQIEKFEDLAGISLHQCNIRRLFSQMASGKNSHCQIRLNKGRRIIDTIAHHGHFFPVSLKVLDKNSLVQWHPASMGISYAQHVSDGPGGLIPISGNKCNVVALVL